MIKTLRWAETCFNAGREAALSALRYATVVASDETDVRIKSTNSFHRVCRCEEAMVLRTTSCTCASPSLDLVATCDLGLRDVWIDRGTGHPGDA